MNPAIARMRWRLQLGLLLGALGVGLAACAGDAADGTDATDLQADFGVDVENRVLRVGALNDESGPVAQIGRPYAVGKRVLAEQINAGGSGLLPDGWTLELVEGDHGYNPQVALQEFEEIKDDVLFFIASFGAPNTLPLIPAAEEDNLVVFPGSFASVFAQYELTPAIGSTYTAEAHQQVEFAIEDGGGVDGVRFAIVHLDDEVGEEVRAGIHEAAAFHGLDIVSEHTVGATETDFTAIITALQNDEVNYVALATTPGGTAAILGTALQLSYQPSWLGNSITWIDGFFDTETVPPQIFEPYHWVTGMTIWGEDVEGMQDFVDAFEAYAGDAQGPDYYALQGYMQGLVAIEAFNRALEDGDVTRDGYLRALRSIDDYDARGLLPQPADLTKLPYEVTTDTRILDPRTDPTDWEIVRPFSTPESYLARE